MSKLKSFLAAAVFSPLFANQLLAAETAEFSRERPSLPIFESRTDVPSAEPGDMVFERNSGSPRILVKDLSSSSWLDLMSGSAGVPGITDGSNATAGYVGEYACDTCTGGGATTDHTGSLNSSGRTGSSSYVQVAKVTLTPGDWDINAAFVLEASIATGDSVVVVGATTASESGTLKGHTKLTLNNDNAGGNFTSVTFPLIRANVTSTTTYYLNAKNPAGASSTYFGSITARRVR